MEQKDSLEAIEEFEWDES